MARSSAPEMMATDRRPRFGLRTLSLAFAVFFGSLVVALAVGLTWTSRLVWDSAQRAERETRAIVLTGEIDRALREYNRLANLLTVSFDPEVESMRRSIESDLSRMLLRMEEGVQGAAETRLLNELAQEISGYFREREALEGQGFPLEQVIRSLRPSVERTLAASALLGSRAELTLRQTQQRAAGLLQLQTLLSVASTVLLVGGLILVTLGVRSLVVRPLLDLQGAIRRFRSGDAEAKAQEGPVKEMRELAVSFNEMADTIAHQRRDQLTFLAGVAHDLRNPLSVLKASVHALESKQAIATPERLQLLGRQIDLLTRMVTDLLDAAGIEAGELEIRCEDFDLREAARAIVELYAETTRIHQIILQTREQPLLVRADPLRIEQVISNLVSNAIKYSPGGGRIEVSVDVADSEAQLSVADHGVGIPAEEIENLYLPFRRRPSTTDMAPGAGLGLSIARRIVHAHGGTILVESTPSRGSTFRVRLPLAQGGRVAPGLAPRHEDRLNH